MCPRFKDDPVSAHNDPHRHEQIVENRASGKRLEQAAADRIDCPRCSDSRIDGTFTAPDPLFDAPVESCRLCANAGGLGLQHEFAAHSSNLWIRNITD